MPTNVNTEYSWMTTDELIQHADCRSTSSTLEKEMAMRLAAALEVIKDMSADREPAPQNMRLARGYRRG